ncbi:MAG: PLP-dependent cysteine synthase family protein [Acidobacteriota bacterium]
MHDRPYESVLDLIGETSVLHVKSLDSPGGGQVYAKLEFQNPGGSVKDRPALHMIRAAEAAGLLRPGTTIIEPTAGNTGIGLAMVGAALGYQVILVMPAGVSREKILLMEALGADIVFTRREERMAGAIARARSLAAERDDVFMPQQFENPANPEGHYRTTGAEAWRQMDGRIDAVVVGGGSGGTFTGVARYVKERNPQAKAILVEPEGSIFAGGLPGCHRVEGIGNSFWPEVLERSLMDAVVTIQDKESYDMVRHLARREGLLVGGSSGANAVAAQRVAVAMEGQGRVVTVFPDGMERYLSRGPAGDSEALSSPILAESQAVTVGPTGPVEQRH